MGGAHKAPPPIITKVKYLSTKIKAPYFFTILIIKWFFQISFWSALSFLNGHIRFRSSWGSGPDFFSSSWRIRIRRIHNPGYLHTRVRPPLPSSSSAWTFLFNLCFKIADLLQSLKADPDPSNCFKNTFRIPCYTFFFDNLFFLPDFQAPFFCFTKCSSKLSRKYNFWFCYQFERIRIQGLQMNANRSGSLIKLWIIVKIYQNVEIKNTK